jgi:hypothetical protein
MVQRQNQQNIFGIDPLIHAYTDTHNALVERCNGERRNLISIWGELIRFMTEHANAHQDAMRGMSEKAAMKYVREIVADNDVVFGVWQESAAPYGVGIRPIKGRQWLEAITTSGVPETLRLNAVPYAEEAQAVAAEQVFGKDRCLRHSRRSIASAK